MDASFKGMLAAEATFSVLNEGLEMDRYWDALRDSWIWEELSRARNYRPVSDANHCLIFCYLYPSPHLKSNLQNFSEDCCCLFKNVNLSAFFFLL